MGRWKDMASGENKGGRAVAGSIGRRGAAALAAAPASVLVAIALAAALHDPAHDPAHDPQLASLSCLNGWLPLHPGYMEEIRAIEERGDKPGPLVKRTDGYFDYFAGASRIGPDPMPRSINLIAKGIPEGMDDETAAMAMVTVINWLIAPPGQCVWEHEYIAWGGRLGDLEYDRDLRCHLADRPAGAPAPYEIADGETRALIGRAGPAPGGDGAFEYVARNTRVEALARDPHRYIAGALDDAGGDAYRAIKVLNRQWWAEGDGCVREGSWTAGGGNLSGLEYSTDHRCYLAPAEVLSRAPGTICFTNPWHVGGTEALVELIKHPAAPAPPPPPGGDDPAPGG